MKKILPVVVTVILLFISCAVENEPQSSATNLNSREEVDAYTGPAVIIIREK